ncbi:MAG TPA: ABC transporter substrate-binding protein [Anaerolineales bacterium]|nr:ABC transporter substrate-binding protein [Anaerolineales bacterium]
MRTYRFVSILVAAAFLLVACGGTPVASTKSPLRLAVNLWPGLYPAAIAQEQGFFAKHNVPVEISYYESYPQTYADLVSGKVDAVSAVIGDVVVISNQTNLKFVFAVDSSDGADEFIVGPDIQSAADLKGKRIGVSFGTYSELFVRTLLEQNGLTTDDVTLVNIPAESAVEAFPSQVDAIHTYEPYGTSVVEKGGHILFTSSETPNLMLGAMMLPAALVKDRPEDIQAFTDAWFEAVDWMFANQDKVPAIVAKVFGLKPEDVWFGGDKVYTRSESQALMQPGNDSSSAYFITQKYADFLAISGALTTKPRPENLIDASFLK